MDLTEDSIMSTTHAALQRQRLAINNPKVVPPVYRDYFPSD